VIVASRWPSSELSVAHPPWPERLLSVRVDAPAPFEAHCLHSPISQKPDEVKLRTHRALHAALDRGRALPQLIVGDLNTPRRELPSGETWSFARDNRGRLRASRGERWERAELALLRGLEAHGIRDLYRALHGYERQEPSWTYPRRRGGYRLDHLIGSAHFAASDCRYLHDAREAGLSDHSPLLANLRFRAANRGSSNGPEP
jgi:endonuclease/exonuclease/phosphatase family metal-dependent hydrolase